MSCERLDALPPPDVFMRDYVAQNRPVLFANALQQLQWPAMHKWTPHYFASLVGNRSVHVKLTPDGDYEGVEPRALWNDPTADDIPQKVLEKLPFPDLVTVRPAGVSVPFGEFVDMLRRDGFSAYMEVRSGVFTCMFAVPNVMELTLVHFSSTPQSHRTCQKSALICAHLR